MANFKDTKKKKEEMTRTLPPMRGQVKVWAIKSLVKTVTCVATKVSEAIVRNQAEEKGSGSSSSSTATPPPSGYDSDVNSDKN